MERDRFVQGRRRGGPGNFAAYASDPCVDLGFCLPAAEQVRLREAPPLDVDEFTDAVFAAEAMDPLLHKQLRRLVRAKVAGRMPEIQTESLDQPRAC